MRTYLLRITDGSLDVSLGCSVQLELKVMMSVLNAMSDCYGNYELMEWYIYDVTDLSLI